MEDTFLQPIEKPKGLIMNLAYYFTRRQFGKVLTPLKVHSARLPAAFGLFYAKVNKLDQKLMLSLSLGLDCPRCRPSLASKRWKSALPAYPASPTSRDRLCLSTHLRKRKFPGT